MEIVEECIEKVVGTYGLQEHKITCFEWTDRHGHHIEYYVEIKKNYNFFYNNPLIPWFFQNGIIPVTMGIGRLALCIKPDISIVFQAPHQKSHLILLKKDKPNDQTAKST